MNTSLVLTPWQSLPRTPISSQIPWLVSRSTRISSYLLTIQTGSLPHLSRIIECWLILGKTSASIIYFLDRIGINVLYYYRYSAHMATLRACNTAGRLPALGQYI
jgi:hypothetical protein